MDVQKLRTRSLLSTIFISHASQEPAGGSWKVGVGARQVQKGWSASVTMVYVNSRRAAMRLSRLPWWDGDDERGPYVRVICALYIEARPGRIASQ